MTDMKVKIAQLETQISQKVRIYVTKVKVGLRSHNKARKSILFRQNV